MSIKYKLFCIDLDGTLLTKFKKISKKNMQYLLKYTCSGGNILINTGRNIVSANSIIEKLKKENIIINFVSALRGAYIVDKINNKIFKSKISDKISHEILDYCTKNKLVIWLYCEKAIKNNIVYGSNWKFCFFLKQLFKNVNVTKIPTNEDLSSYKINVSSIFKKKINLMQKFLNENYTNSLSWCKHNNLLEINNANIDKSTSINIVKKILNINSKDIASIGDSINDYDMFRNSQKKFAMKKLAKKNKQFRYTRIKSRKNGVAEAIKKYF